MCHNGDRGDDASTSTDQAASNKYIYPIPNRGDAALTSTDQAASNKNLNILLVTVVLLLLQILIKQLPININILFLTVVMQFKLILGDYLVPLLINI